MLMNVYLIYVYSLIKDRMKTTKPYLKDLIYNVNGAAIEVHKYLGPGLLECIYHKCLEKEFKLRKLHFNSQLIVPVSYKGLSIDTSLKCDFLVEDILIVELKSVAYILPVHIAQVLTYMQLLQSPKGILINFNVTNIYNEGQQTFVNELYRGLPDY